MSNIEREAQEIVDLIARGVTAERLGFWRSPDDDLYRAGAKLARLFATTQGAVEALVQIANGDWPLVPTAELYAAMVLKRLGVDPSRPRGGR